MKPYPKYKDSGVEWIGNVPEGWTPIRTRFLFQNGYQGIKIGPFGSALKLQDMVQDGIKVYGQENVIANDFQLGDRFISQNKFFEMLVYEIKSGDILITMMGTSGQCQIVPDYAITGIIDSHLIRLRVNEKLILPTYFRLLIDESKYVRHQILMLGKGSIMHGLNSSIIKELLIILPPIKDQKSISTYLDHKTAQIDNLISKKQKLIELLKEERAATINQAVTKGLNPDAPMKDSGIEWLGEIPAHWEAKRLKYFFGLITEKNCSLQTKKVALENIESWTGRFIDSEVDYQGEGISFLKGDVLFGKLRPYLAKVLNAQFSGASVGDIFVMRPKLGVSSRFAFYRFLSKPFIDIVNGSTFGAKMPRVSWDFIANLHIAMPNNNEQRTISGYLDSKTTKIDQTISKIENQIDLLQEFRTALISEVVTGKIDVRDEGSNG